jgi:hypothetical protein
MPYKKVRSTCPYCPDETVWEPDPSYDNPNCICNKPMMIYIPAGQHIHCPVHPDFKMYGSSITCDTTNRMVGGCVYEHDPSKDLTFDSTRPFGTATGDTIRDTYKVIC